MIAFRLFSEIHDLLKDLHPIAQVKSENSHSFKIEAAPVSGIYMFGGEKGKFEFRFFDMELTEDLQIIRTKSNLDVWYLSLIYGNIRLLSPTLNTQQIRAIATAELHNLKKDDIVIFKAPGHIQGCSIRMGMKFILNSMSDTDNLFPFIKETRHFAILESLDHEMIDRLIKTFKIAMDSPVFEKRIETSAKDLSYCFLEKVAGRKNDFSSKIQDDFILQKMLHANTLFNDYNHPPTLQQISRFVGIGPSKAHELFKQVYGKTPYQFFNEKRMNEAYDLLHSGIYNIAQIGTMLGFANMSHFSKTFKKHFGILPKKMQKQRIIL